MEPTPDDTQKIILAVEENDHTYYCPIIEAFQDENPDIQVQL
jgi:hypothetical protein